MLMHIRLRKIDDQFLSINEYSYRSHRVNCLKREKKRGKVDIGGNMRYQGEVRLRKMGDGKEKKRGEKENGREKPGY